MVDEERPEEQPSLELPSLGGWRRKRRPRTPKPTPARAPDPVGGEQATIVLPEAGADAPPRSRRIRFTPHRLGGYAAALGVGAAVGLLMVGLMWGSLQTCEQVQGTSSCGTAGYPVLLVVLVLAVVVGGLLLRLLTVPDPVSTSVLGTGLTAVLSLLVLIDHLDQPAMVVVVPVLTAACFAAAHWVTTTFIEPGGR